MQTTRNSPRTKPRDTNATNGATWTITTAIPYVNAKPHIGFALEMIQGDVLARFRRSQGYDVRFQAGTDENSLKNVLAAENAGVPVQEFVDRNAAAFLELEHVLGLSVDDTIRTSCDPRHRPGVERLWRACSASGDLYQKHYEGLYCAGCEQFYKPDDLDQGHCREHRTAADKTSETNYFFRLSRYQHQLYDLIGSDTIEVVPRVRKNEVLRWIEDGLEDFSVSRSSQRARGWGLPVPDDPDQVIYVWFDALANYITALDYGGNGRSYRKHWQEASAREHVIGKGITRFHAVYWPAILLSAGLPLPTRIFVHGYVTIDGRKISKSLGTAIDPAPLVETYGSDALRYYLLRHVRTGEDGDFSPERLAQSYQSELADQLGNLAHRTASMIVRYGVDIRSQEALQIPSDPARTEFHCDLGAQVGRLIEGFAFHEALAEIWATIALANKSIANSAPWNLAKRIERARTAREAAVAKENLDRALLDVVHALQSIARALAPFMPTTSTRLLQQFGGGERHSGTTQESDSACLTPFPAQEIGLLFPKLRK